MSPRPAPLVPRLAPIVASFLPLLSALGVLAVEVHLGHRPDRMAMAMAVAFALILLVLARLPARDPGGQVAGAPAWLPGEPSRRALLARREAFALPSRS